MITPRVNGHEELSPVRLVCDRSDRGVKGAAGSAGDRRPDLFVPALPTVWPNMLLRGRRAHGFPPFTSPSVSWHYLGRNAVFSAIERLGIAGGEVLMPAYHHGVEVEAAMAAGARPRFYQVGRRWDVDVEDVESRIGPRTRALYLTHFGGFPGPTRELRSLADERGLALIEDCALSLLSSDRHGPLGTTGDAAVFCLYKTLPLPHGGALALSDPPGRESELGATSPVPAPLLSTLVHSASSLLANPQLRGGAAVRSLRRAVLSFGRQALDTAQVRRVGKGTAHFEGEHVALGMSRLALRLAWAQDLPAIVERRRRNYRLLLEGLAPHSPPLFDRLPAGVSPLFYPLVVDDKAAVLRELWAGGIEAVDFWSVSHPACDRQEFPDVAWLRHSVLEIPCHQDLSPARVKRLIDAVREAICVRW